jgi:hypothetical protein
MLVPPMPGTHLKQKILPTRKGNDLISLESEPICKAEYEGILEI